MFCQARVDKIPVTWLVNFQLVPQVLRPPIVSLYKIMIATSQLSVLFKFEDGKINEERWFIDTEQWKTAF